MADIINLLPDPVANQIAAGEVIQRPSSAVKELMENAIDAGATYIKLIVKEAGSKLIQVIDNGCGMSETDARMCFEKHATSKIKSVDDLFEIRTMGFRGEALASIAAIAQVELKSKKHDEDLGTKINIQGTEVKSQEACQSNPGTSIAVKNLFFNVPARRNFLKSNSVEMRHIIDEFQRIALIHPEISFDLYHDDLEVFRLKSGNLRQRIIAIFGDRYNQKLVPVEEKTEVVNISGFIGKAEFAKKTRGEQFFFVNNRFIKSAYLNHAVMGAFEDILPSKTYPLYILSLEIDPKRIDINVHPTKQEIKFDDEKIVYAFVNSAVKHALGQYSVTPTLDFEQETTFSSLPSVVKGPPKDLKATNVSTSSSFRNTSLHTKNVDNWEELYKVASKPSIPTQVEKELFETEKSQQETVAPTEDFFNPIQIHQTYIVAQTKTGMVIVHQQHAHERILYDALFSSLENNDSTTQKELFTKTIELTASDATLMKDILEDVNALGFDIEEFGKNAFIINGIPADITDANPEYLIEQLLEQFKNSQNNLKLSNREIMLRSLAKSSSIKKGKKLASSEMDALLQSLFECENPQYTPDGKRVIKVLGVDELEKLF